MSRTRKKTVVQNVALGLNTATGTTPDIQLEEATSGQIHIPSGSPITTLTYHTKISSADTPLPAQDAAGSPVTQTVAAAKSYPIPAILFGAPIIKIVVNSAGNVGISLKS